MGSARMGSLRISYLLTEGLFGYSFYPIVIFPNLSELITFAAAPLVLTSFVRNQLSDSKDDRSDESRSD